MSDRIALQNAEFDALTELEAAAALAVHDGKGTEMPLKSKPCCAKFAEETGRLQAPAGGGMMYPAGMRPSAQIERDRDGEWNVNGCCGGGCYVLAAIKFCPFCGARLA